MKVKKIGDWTLEDRLGLKGRSLVVLFDRTGNEGLPRIHDQFKKAAEEHPDAEFLVLDLLENPSLAHRYAIPRTPIVMVFVDGVEVGRHVGTSIAATIDRVLGPCPLEDDEADESS